jgi:isoleucyl-tRNA synthetase
MWSPVEKTALAEAEIEYEDITSTQIDVAFKIMKCPKRPELNGAYAVIWTTTPWTLPVNRALAYGADVDYLVISAKGKKYLVAEVMAAEVTERWGFETYDVVAHIKGADLEGAFCQHPWAGKSEFFDEPRPMLAGDFVTTDAGTGIVHMAPDHGEDDFYLCKAHGIDPVFVVQPDGGYKAGWPVVGGQNVLNNKLPQLVIEAFGEACLAHSGFRHSYPHSWRSKKKVIYRCTPQWFISMEKTGLRDKALKAIAETRFVPEAGRNRIQSMVEGRPDWVVSRQRAWGVPITVFVNKETGDVLRDAAVNDRIAAAVEAKGADAWFADDPETFLGNGYKAADFEQVSDILDVWFDSGSTHAFVLESGKWPDLSWPADLYLEGSDQHRGWFQSSLLESCGTRGRAPYKAVLTHGFVLDGERRKMSKSLGNVVAPQKIVDQYGADILRLWVSSTDYSDDVPIGDEIIKSQTEAYRKMRNTLRYLLANLSGFDEAERLPQAEMPELERWVLHRLYVLDDLINRAADDFNFTRIYNAIYNFCNVDLSIFYFDIRKDTLYCDAKSSVRRRAARTVLDEVFHCLTRWLAPILAFTAEEAWQTRFLNPDDSIHLQQFRKIPGTWQDAALAEKWEKIRSLRRVVTGALEVDRREKRIGASLQARADVYVQDHAFVKALEGVDLAEISITSEARLIEAPSPAGAYKLEDVPHVGVVTGLATGEKCQRCWQVLPEVGKVAGHDDLCHRCVDAVAEQA